MERALLSQRPDGEVHFNWINRHQVIEQPHQDTLCPSLGKLQILPVTARDATETLDNLCNRLPDAESGNFEVSTLWARDINLLQGENTVELAVAEKSFSTDVGRSGENN